MTAILSASQYNTLPSIQSAHATWTARSRVSSSEGSGGGGDVELLRRVGQLIASHGQANEWAVQLVHRHFALFDGEILVNTGNVSVPVRLGGNDDDDDAEQQQQQQLVQRGLEPVSWTFLPDGKAQAFEYAHSSEMTRCRVIHHSHHGGSATSPQADDAKDTRGDAKAVALFTALSLFLREHALAGVLGLTYQPLRILDDEGARVETTYDRANVVLPRELVSAHDRANAVDAIWSFKDSENGVVKVECLQQVRQLSRSAPDEPLLLTWMTQCFPGDRNTHFMNHGELPDPSPPADYGKPAAGPS